jgi:hypothetical protein
MIWPSKYKFIQTDHCTSSAANSQRSTIPYFTSFTQQLNFATTLLLPEGRAGTPFVTSKQHNFLIRPILVKNITSHCTSLSSFFFSGSLHWCLMD